MAEVKSPRRVLVIVPFAMTAENLALREQQLQLTPTQTKAINKLFDAGPDDFANGIGTEKYVNLCRVSRATAYRELPALCEMGVLVQTGIGRGTRYRLQLGEGCGLY